MTVILLDKKACVKLCGLIFMVMGSVLFSGLFQAGGPAPAFAQDCSVTEESIIRLRPPSYGNRRTVDIIYGETGYERFSDLIMLDPEHFVLAGDYTVGEMDTIFKPMILKMNIRGDVIWENREETIKDRPLKKLIADHTNGFVALAEETEDGRRGFSVVMYNASGEKKNRIPFFMPGLDLSAAEIIKSQDKEAYLIAAQVHDKEDPSQSYGIIYKISSNGKRIWTRSYKPGNATFFHGIHEGPNKSYLVSGQILYSDGRLAGWHIQIDEQGAIQNQRNFPRGSLGLLRASAVTPDNGTIHIGEVEPSGGGRSSAWVMKRDQAGTVEWQRYYTGDYNYMAYDLIQHPDGRTDVLISGKSLKSRDGRPHVSILTLSPRGYLMNVESFSEGRGAGARSLIQGKNGNRFFSGTAQISIPDNVPAYVRPPYTFDAWLVGMQGLQTYSDPCAINPLDDIRPFETDPF